MPKANVTDFMDNIEDFDREIPDEVFVAGELEVEIVSIDFHVSEDDNPYPRFAANLKIVGNEEAELIFHTLWLPTKDDDKRSKNRRQRALRDFVRAFGYDWPLPLTDFNNENFKGRSSWANVANQVNRRNNEKEHVIKGWIAPA
jgi:hypothetical protein